MERGPPVSKGPFTTMRMTQWRRSLAQESVKRITPNRDMFRASQIKTRVPITLSEKHKLDRVLRCNFFFETMVIPSANVERMIDFVLH